MDLSYKQSKCKFIVSVNFDMTKQAWIGNILVPGDNSDLDYWIGDGNLSFDEAKAWVDYYFNACKHWQF